MRLGLDIDTNTAFRIYCRVLARLASVFGLSPGKYSATRSLDKNSGLISDILKSSQFFNDPSVFPFFSFVRGIIHRFFRIIPPLFFYKDNPTRRISTASKNYMSVVEKRSFQGGRSSWKDFEK